jgi:hypothetical protein
VHIQVLTGVDRELSGCALNDTLALGDANFEPARIAHPDHGWAKGFDGGGRRVDLIDRSGVDEMKRGEAVRHLDFGEFALVIAVKGAQGRDRTTSQSKHTAVIELNLAPASVRDPYLGALAHR